MRAIHLIDTGTTGDALEMLGTLVGRSSGVIHRVLMLGHRAAGERAARAGVPKEIIGHIHTMGWADPAGWRGVGKAIKDWEPTHVHAWGIRGVVAASVHTGFSGPRIATFAVAPTDAQLRLLRAAASRAAWTWVGTSTCVVRALVTGGLAATSVVRIRPGITLSAGAGVSGPAVRRELGIGAGVGPVIALGGEPEAGARPEQGMWAAAIVRELYPRIRVIVRLGEDRVSQRVRAFMQTLPGPKEEPWAIEAPLEMPWSTLVRAADLLLVPAAGPMATGSILWAMAAGVPVLGTATPEVSELVEQGYNGMLAPIGKRTPGATPRNIAARIETFMSDSTLRWPLADKARADVYAHFKPGFMLECFRALYQQTQVDPRAAVELPQPDLTAADRFAGAVDLG